MPSTTPKLDDRVVMCNACATTRSISSRFPITASGRYLRCSTCDRPTKHHTTDATRDHRESINSAPARRAAIRREQEALDVCARLGLTVRYVDGDDLEDRAGTQVFYGVVPSPNGTLALECHSGLTPEGRALAIKRAVGLAFDCANSLGIYGRASTDPDLTQHLIDEALK